MFNLYLGSPEIISFYTVKVFSFLLLPAWICSPVMEVPKDNPFTEEQGRLYFRDIILGIEYCKYSIYTW